MLEASILESKPLSIQDLLVEVPKVLWSDIGGGEEIKFKVK
jgi:SpoVK/Ycf46/Vps4 family AAA+-type ATPase